MKKVLTGKVRRDEGKSGRLWVGWNGMGWDGIRGKSLVVSDKNKGELRARGASTGSISVPSSSSG